MKFKVKDAEAQAIRKRKLKVPNINPYLDYSMLTITISLTDPGVDFDAGGTFFERGVWKSEPPGSFLNRPPAPPSSMMVTSGASRSTLSRAARACNYRPTTMALSGEEGPDGVKFFCKCVRPPMFGWTAGTR